MAAAKEAAQQPEQEQPEQEQPAERVFTATHGVDFADENGRWAHFKAAPERRQPNGPEVFEFRTTDAKTAARVAAVNDYGITEVTGDDSAD